MSLADLTAGKLRITVLDEVEVSGIPRAGLFVQFNPTEYSVERSTHYAETAIPGLDAPVLQFVRGEGDSVTLELWTDLTDLMIDGVLAGPDVRALFVKPLERLLMQHRELHAPPRVRVSWGVSVVISEAVATSLSATYQLFDRLGRPVRATARLQLRQHSRAETLLDEAALTSPDRVNAVVVRERDTLPSIAHRFYRDAARWRAIAEANELDDPLDLPVGRELVVPKVV